MQCSNIDWEGAEDDCGDDRESDRHSEQDPLSVRTAQTARCSGEEQHQREDHGEDGVAVSRWLNGLASPDPGKYNAVGPTPYERQADAFHLSWVRTRKDRRGTMKAYGTAVALSSTPA